MNIRRVDNADDFRYVLSRKWADWIILSEHCQFDEPIEVSRPVKISTEKAGCFQYTHYQMPIYNYGLNREEDGVEHSLFLVKSLGVEFDGAKIEGGGKLLTDYYIDDGLQSAIKMDFGAGTCSVNNCDISGFNWGAVWAFDVQEAIVTGNTITGPDCPYYNYGTWQGGRGNAQGQRLYFALNSVSGVRHAVGASEHPNSYYAFGNHIYSTSQQVFDRHGLTGGLDTHIIGNTFYDPDHYAFKLSEPGGAVTFSGNTLARSATKPTGQIGDQIITKEYDSPTCKVFGNRFGG